MDRQDEIKDILLNILRVGLLRIRAFGNSGLAESCASEADHLHNLPTLIQSLHNEALLDYYYNTERPAFLSSTTSNIEAFKPLWDQLGVLIQMRKSAE